MPGERIDFPYQFPLLQTKKSICDLIRFFFITSLSFSPLPQKGLILSSSSCTTQYCTCRKLISKAQTRGKLTWCFRARARWEQSTVLYAQTTKRRLTLALVNEQALSALSDMCVCCFNKACHAGTHPSNFLMNHNSTRPMCKETCPQGAFVGREQRLIAEGYQRGGDRQMAWRFYRAGIRWITIAHGVCISK